jgi:hypothetical protein
MLCNATVVVDVMSRFPVRTSSQYDIKVFTVFFQASQCLVISGNCCGKARPFMDAARSVTSAACHAAKAAFRAAVTS